MESSDLQDKMNKVGEAVKMAGLPGRIVIGFLLAALISAGAFVGLLETNGAGYVTVKQSMLTGKVTIISEPGVFCQCFGTITKYREAGTVKFAKAPEGPGGKAPVKPGKTRETTIGVSGEIEVRFNDGGLGWISVMTLFDLPKETEKLGLIHKKFRSYRNLVEAGIKPTIEEAVVLTAALMNSGESYTTKRATFSGWSRDQLSHGTYITEEVTNKEKDQIGNTIEKSKVKIKTEDGNKLRNENPLERYGITFKQFQVTLLRYEAETETLIKIKREALQQTMAAKIAAERAIQERLAAEDLGKKKVKIAEYEAMVKKKKAEVAAEEEKAIAVINAEKKLAVAKVTKLREHGAANKKVELEKLEKIKAVIKATKVLEVAKLNVLASESNKRSSILEGQGLGEKKRLIYQADGALEMKLDAYVKVMTVLAKELGKQKWVPDITMNGGGGGTKSGNAAASFMDLWMMKAAKDLGVDLANGNKKR